MVKIPEPEKKLADELKQQTKNMNELKNQLDKVDNGLEQTNDELKLQMKNIQELLNRFIENSSSNNFNNDDWIIYNMFTWKILIILLHNFLSLLHNYLSYGYTFGIIKLINNSYFLILF